MKDYKQKKIYLDDFYEVIAFLLILIMPIFRYYNFFGSTIGFEAVLKILVFTTFALLFLLPNRKRVYHYEAQKSGNRYVWFALYAILVSSGYEIFYSPYKERSANIAISFIISAILILMLLWGSLNFLYVFKMYSFIVWLMVFICAIQWILLLSGHRIGFNLPGLEYSDSWTQLSSQVFGMNENPTALFSEKAHFCEYLIPYVAICLFDPDIVKGHRFVKAIIVSAFIIMTVSGNGFILVFLCWGLYFAFFNNYDFRNRIILVILGIVIIAISFVALAQVDTINSMLSVLFTNNQYGYSKANYRVYRGFDVYSRLPFLQKIIGVGYYRMQDFANVHNITSIFDRSWGMYEYFSAFTQVLIYFGFIGFVLMIFHLIPLFRGQSHLTKSLIIIFVAISLSSEILFQGFHLMFLLLLLSSIQFNICNESI